MKLSESLEERNVQKYYPRRNGILKLLHRKVRKVIFVMMKNKKYQYLYNVLFISCTIIMLYIIY